MKYLEFFINPGITRITFIEVPIIKDPLYRSTAYIWVKNSQYIIGSITFYLLISLPIGLLNFKSEANAIKLWIPATSDFAKNYDYLWNNYPPDIRFHSIVFLAPENDPDILQPKYIQHIYKTYQELRSLTFGTNNQTWQDFCLK